jgi:hypothetical protein
MRLRNRNGTAVDGVPFLVVCAMAFLVTFSFGPLYGSALGLSIPTAVVGSAVAFVVAVCGAYYRLIWQARPGLDGEIPADQRLIRLFYAAIALGLLLVLLALPLVYQSVA